MSGSVSPSHKVGISWSAGSRSSAIALAWALSVSKASAWLRSFNLRHWTHSVNRFGASSAGHRPCRQR